MAHRRRPAWVWWTVGLVGSGAVVAVQFLPIRSTVEDSLTSRSRTALADAGYPGLDVTFNGRDGVISGVLDPADVSAVEGVVRQVTGVRVVRVDSGQAAGPGSAPSGAATTAPTPMSTATSGTAPGGSSTASAAPSPTVAAQVRTPIPPAPSGSVSSMQSANTEPPMTSQAATSSPPPTTTPAPTASPAPTATPGSGQTAGMDGALASLPPILFGSSRFSVSPESDPTIQAIADIIAATPAGQRYEVRAHTDTTGSAGGNLWLSDQRAAAVVSALVGRGIAADRLSGLGLGESQLLVSPEVSPEDRARNRRVEIVAVP